VESAAVRARPVTEGVYMVRRGRVFNRRCSFRCKRSGSPHRSRVFFSLSFAMRENKFEAFCAFYVHFLRVAFVLCCGKVEALDFNLIFVLRPPVVQTAASNTWVQEQWLTRPTLNILRV